MGGKGAAMIAALFVQHGGVYSREGVEPWALPYKDARLYNGPHSVVAHPPCERWGQFSTGGFGINRHETGDDGGCFASALKSVRAYGGVLEHPAKTKAFAHHGIARPFSVGWSDAGDGVGKVCAVNQGDYGHLALKPTWLYAVGCELPDIARGIYRQWWHEDESKSERWKARADKDGVCVLLSREERAATPVAFAELLIRMAESVKRQ